VKAGPVVVPFDAIHTIAIAVAILWKVYGTGASTRTVTEIEYPWAL